MSTGSRLRLLTMAVAVVGALTSACTRERDAAIVSDSTGGSVGAEGNVTAAAQVTTPAIDAEELRARLLVFADDSMEGRAAGSRGHERALRYLEREVQRLGLLPGGDSVAGEPRSYRQRVPLVQSVENSASESFNIVAILPGRDSTLDEYVALGAHSDHVGMMRRSVDHDSMRAANREAWVRAGRGATPNARAEPAPVPLRRREGAAWSGRRDSIYNGADDDGSGSVALLEIAEALREPSQRPRRSLLFVWHTGEELGLDGSTWFVQHSPVPLARIVAQLNVDMIGRGTAEDLAIGSADYLAVIGPRRLSTQLARWVEEVNRKEPKPLALDYGMDADGHPENIYCRSDHAMYAARGIPVAFFFTNLHEDYHEVTDEVQYIDFPHYTRIVRYLASLSRFIGDAPRRPIVDGVRPDPNAPCRQ